MARDFLFLALSLSCVAIYMSICFQSGWKDRTTAVKPVFANFHITQRVDGPNTKRMSLMQTGYHPTAQSNVTKLVPTSLPTCGRPVTNFVFIKVHKTASGSTFMVLARFGRNHGMTICYPKRRRKAMHIQLSYPRTIAGWYSVVLITEYWEESLVLLKRKFCWTLYDILHTTDRLHALHTKKEHIPLTTEQKQNHRKMSNIDYVMYDYLNETFWQHITKEGSEFWDEVTYYKTLNSEVNKHCNSVGGKRVFPAGKWSQEFVIDSTFCKEWKWKEGQWAGACWDEVEKQNKKAKQKKTNGV
ncbi:uncharacterized protein LOC144865087 isoform X2 [Branchiostoma floridae x Branchiostoma japonicum]